MLRSVLLTALTVLILSCAHEKPTMFGGSLDPYDVNLEKSLKLSPPNYPAFNSNTRYVREIMMPCLGPPELTVSFEWEPEGVIKASVTMAKTDIWSEGWSRNGNVLSQAEAPAVPAVSCVTSIDDPLAAKALEIAWAQLSSLTFYEESGCDGAFYRYETYDSSGLKRRLQLWTPTKAYQGADLAVLLGVLERRVLVQCRSQLSARVKKKDPAYSHWLSSVPQDPLLQLNEFHQDLTKAIQAAQDNEPLVKSYVPPPPEVQRFGKEVITIPPWGKPHHPDDKVFESESPKPIVTEPGT